MNKNTHVNTPNNINSAALTFRFFNAAYKQIIETLTYLKGTLNSIKPYNASQ